MAQNKKPTEDLRVRRTRKLLIQALIDLTVEKGFSALTVQDIADRAMINRATFYRHFQDKYHLLDQYMNEVYELTAAQEQLPLDETDDTGLGNPPSGMVHMLYLVQTHAAFYRAMLGARGDLAFVQSIQRYSEMRLRILLSSNEFQFKAKGVPLELCMNYLSHAGVGALAWWLKTGDSYTPEQVAAWLNQLNQGILEQL